jgi:hypothetical protein
MTTPRAIGQAAVVALTLGVTVLAAGRATAAEPLSIAAQTSWGSETSLGVGGRVSWGDMPALVMGLDRWLATEKDGLRTARWEAQVNGVFRLRARACSVRPYLGAGMSFVRTAGQVTLVTWDVSAAQHGLGANVIAGVDVRMARRYDAYIETRGQIWGTRQVALSAGLRVALIR